MTRRHKTAGLIWPGECVMQVGNTNKQQTDEDSSLSIRMAFLLAASQAWWTNADVDGGGGDCATKPSNTLDDDEMLLLWLLTGHPTTITTRQHIKTSIILQQNVAFFHVANESPMPWESDIERRKLYTNI